MDIERFQPVKCNISEQYIMKLSINKMINAEYTFKYGDTVLQNVDKIKYLGVKT